MSLPNLPSKFSSKPIFSAADLLTVRRTPKIKPPQRVILSLHDPLLPKITGRFKAKPLAGFYGKSYLVRTKTPTVLVGAFGIGAPVISALVEEWAAFGAEEFVLLGLAGGLQPALNTGDIILCDRAIRDEGTSYHYLPHDHPVAPSSRLFNALSQRFHKKKLPFQTGATWTTDAPYRETIAEVHAYQAQGVLTVEMEASALFAVGEALGVDTAAVFVVADRIEDGRWQLDVNMTAVMKSLLASYKSLT